MAKTTASRKATSDKDDPAREEWDFSACPKDKLYFCFAYEIARDLARTLPAFRARFDKAPASEFDENKNWHYFLTGGLDESGGNFDLVELVEAPQGFPKKAYLTLNHQPTRASYHPFNVGFPFVKQEWPIQEIFFDGQAFHSGDLAEQMNLNPRDFYSLTIDWNCSPKEIAKAFQKWMEAKRPHPPRERRGKNSVRHYRRRLKELGAYRLIEACGSLHAAWDYTMDIGLNKGRGLFTQEYLWYDARNKTRKILAEWRAAFEHIEKESFPA